MAADRVPNVRIDAVELKLKSGEDLPGVTTARILEQVIEGYQAALQQDADAIEDAPKSIQLVMKKSLARSWKKLANERLQDQNPTIPRGTKFWSLSKSERASIDDMFQTPALRHLATSLKSREDDVPVEVEDAAYWMKGCSSLGLLRFAVLLGIGKRKKRTPALMDVKEAIAAAAPRYAREKMPKDQAQRVSAASGPTIRKNLRPHSTRRYAKIKRDRKVWSRSTS